MKLYKKVVFSVFSIVLTIGVSSCKKWIDVSPKTQVEESKFFSNQQGYIEALTGVYLKMVSTNLYGRELTFGFLDAIGRTYEITGAQGGQYLEAFNGTYRNDGTIAAIYTEGYSVIANLNNIIEHIETADQTIFSSGEYQRIRGEALGLRAFMHFDLLRLYTKAYSDEGANSLGIPYVTTNAAAVTPRILVKDMMAKIISDLTAAESLLVNETIVKGTPSVALNSQFDERKQFFNYYAVKATKARAYLWMQDKASALAEAEAIIAVAPARFPFVTQASIIATDPGKNRVFTSEHLFGITAEKLATNYVGYLDTVQRGTPLVIQAPQKALIYEGIITDYRSQYLLKDLTTSADPLILSYMKRVYFSKLHQPSTSNRMPLIKIPEMYYIAAECLSDTDPAKAIGYLNLVRQSRGISTALSLASTPDVVMTEIQKEYRKEMPSEGQIFFFYKRKKSTALPYFVGNFPSSRYVLPLPQQEIDFGF